MILVHNTMSYLEPTHKIWNLFKFIWKCQDISIVQMLGKLGDSYIPDIHLVYMNPGWRFCSYFVDLGITINNQAVVDLIEQICQNKAKVRLVLERQYDSDSIRAFKQLISEIKKCTKVGSIDSILKHSGAWITKETNLKYKRFNWKYYNINFSLAWNFNVWRKSKFMTKYKFSKENQVTESMVSNQKYCYKVDFVKP